jgi:hypothetical protein
MRKTVALNTNLIIDYTFNEEIGNVIEKTDFYCYDLKRIIDEKLSLNYTEFENFSKQKDFSFENFTGYFNERLTDNK